MIMAVMMKWGLSGFVEVSLVAVMLAGCGSPEKPPAPAPKAEIKPVPQIKDDRPIIAAFGDSISAGFGVEQGKSFPDDLQRLIDKSGKRYHVLNLGVSGDTTTDGLERLPSVIVSKPAIVILELGANDGLRGQPVEVMKVNLGSILQGLQDAGIKKIVLAGITLPRNYGPEYIASFDKVFPELAKQFHVTLIPFVLDGVGGNAALTQADGLHPTAEGAQIVAETVMKYLKPLL